MYGGYFSLQRAHMGVHLLLFIWLSFSTSSARNYICIFLLNFTSLVLPLSLETSTPRIHASQNFLTLTNFIEKSINIYDIKWVFYENIFYNKSNGINLVL